MTEGKNHLFFILTTTYLRMTITKEFGNNGSKDKKTQFLKYRILSNRIPILIRTFCIIFSKRLSKITVFLGQILPKKTIVQWQKILNFNRTPAFYMRGYGILYLYRPLCSHRFLQIFSVSTISLGILANLN